MSATPEATTGGFRPAGPGATPGAAPDGDGANGRDGARAVLEWQLARRAIELGLADPSGLGGVVLHGRHGPSRDALLATLASRGPVRRVPTDADDDALFGGLDTTATLARGRAVERPGLLDASPGETLLLGGAERLSSSLAGRLRRWLDDDDRADARAPLIVLDESLERSGLVESALGERLALHVEVPPLALAELRAVDGHGGNDDGAATGRVRAGGPADVVLPDGTLDALVRLAARLGIDSLRVAALACRAARANAWRDGRDAVDESDAALAAQLVLAPRARVLPEADASEAGEPAPDEREADVADAERGAPADAPANDVDPPDRAEPPSPDGEPSSPEERDDPQRSVSGTPLPERLVAAVAAALPSNLLDELVAGRVSRDARGGGDASANAATGHGGRPVGTRRPHGSARVRPNLVATLKAAIPWQRLRGAEPPRLKVVRDDLRVTRHRRPVRTTTLFVVDASGSAAMHRLAEAKGAVESLLAECYVRRDRVALVTFRGTEATLDLPPTRSLVRAKRALIGLPGGGGTPLATGLDLAAAQLERLAADGESPVGVIMTDGSANIARDGTASRARAREDAEAAARRLARIGARLLFVDTGPRPRPATRALAATMGARYLPLPQLDTAALAAGAGR